MADCLFCKIAAGQVPGEKVYEDENVVAFLDIYPTSAGHTLVIPKVHYADLPSTPPATLAKVAAALPQIAAAVVKATGADGFNVLQSNGSCAGQVVFHLHFHILPRKAGDGIHIGFRPTQPSAGELRKTADAIRAAF